ncbi:MULTISPECIES: restriction endonuclease subunit S [Vibrio]|uniref:restriction endonuclease subunit S n=1 Tax=Vibrio TaxID=662 RepID=UPI001C678D62|nr:MULTISPECIES: restriction endonuclease subunit S [Vibrio]
MTFPSYDCFKSIDANWLGRVPSHWEVVRLRYLFKRVKRTNCPEKELLSVYRDYGVIPKNSRDDNHNKPSDDLSPYQLVESGDLVMNKMKAWQGSIAISEYEGIVSPAYFVYSFSGEGKNAIDSKYVHYLLRSPAYITQYMARSKGIRVNQWDLEPEAFEHIEVLLPTIKEQKAIATFLDRETQRIDSLIEEKQTFIKLLKEKRQALISHVVTKGLNPNVEMQDSGIEWIGQVPKHWEVKKIKHICSNFMYGTSQDCNQSDVGYPVLRIPNIKSTNVDFEDLKYANISDVDALTYLLSRGDILVIRTNGNPNLVGQSALFDSNGQYLFASYLIKLTPKRGVDTSFLVEAMNSLSVRQALTFQSRTSVGNYNLSIPSLANTSIAIPPIDEQKTITNYLSAATINIDLLIQETDKSIALLKEHRTSLISAAVTGKIDVREAV